MTIKAYTLAITLAVVGPLVVSMTGGSFAAPALSGTSVLKAAAPMATTYARYRKNKPRYWDYSADWDYPTYGLGYDTGGELYCYLPSSPCDNNHRVTN
jgi:hypothetical protein